MGVPSLSSGRGQLTQVFAILFVLIMIRLKIVERRKADRRAKNKISLAGYGGESGMHGPGPEKSEEVRLM